MFIRATVSLLAWKKTVTVFGARHTCTTTGLNLPQMLAEQPGQVTVLGSTYNTDSATNVSPRILTRLDWRLHNQKCHPINIIRQRIQNFFYSHFLNRSGNPMFSVYDNLSPVVTLEQNFDSLFVPENHPSRAPSDSYYINQKYMLRAHTSAHQRDLIRSGLDAFLVVGDVYRRDTIDKSHYPVFHQMEGVRLYTEHELFSEVKDPRGLSLFEDGRRLSDKQETHSLEAAKLSEHRLKSTLEKLAVHLFGKDIEMRWVEAYFPFTHPSWELEIKFAGEWLEVLGCGTMEQKLLHSGGAGDKVGWAFGLGLDRLAMLLFDIPDIRIFWSRDSGFLSQFNIADINSDIKYKPIPTMYQ
ncbi:phenylalanine--tRNA ligase, mitochondrial-like isoform X2 [Liolophura sinensis]|uniref:phenylalanine--tRNA ligase, mitochondrial-like isoform X2 n=1 Tax=Liolophura sinensis TaxID=3198878 RepID=UPI003157FDD4